MKYGLTAAALLLLALNAVPLLLAYFRGRGEYEDYLEPLDEKEFKTRNLLGAGLFLQERFPIADRFRGPAREALRRYGVRVSGQLTELYGVRDREYYGTIHTANKWVIALLTGTFLALFALISCSNGDLGAATLFCAATPVGVCAMPFLLDKELDGKVVERREKIQLEFPEFVNKLILLVNAGSTISKAWEKIVTDSRSNSPLYRELRFCAAEIQNGRSEAAAYEEFARRCKLKEVIKFVSVIVLNLRKGGGEVVFTLRLQADECWEARKAAARRLGEKASSKLLMPMAIMLLGIIMVVALPAILALSGM